MPGYLTLAAAAVVNISMLKGITLHVTEAWRALGG